MHASIIVKLFVHIYDNLAWVFADKSERTPVCVCMCVRLCSGMCAHMRDSIFDPKEELRIEH